ncbi:hypothetical protein CLV84_2137 [Neolewinella xylanilytica]|uniref:Uncharacterized protein n=1 Tax=Neolewinella xylanilytica TaxID=1514080 RepID=A0A2S6I242_9BACT|nr:hypothetical protein [Neolewinella xylanilytica]PPK85245.1 hypothetical protein CLV84_2137 [Neolewinella xylanilytica]
MSAHNTKNPSRTEDQDPGGKKIRQSDRTTDAQPKERERIRDMIVVFVTYPLTPTKETNRLAEKKPWLEFLSLLLKVALALYALYEAAFR